VTIHTAVFILNWSRAPTVTRNVAFPSHEVLMLRSNRVFAVALSLALAACASSRSPVPVVGTASDVSALTGDWAGDYSSAQSGRSGSISFTLRASGDSAFGDVVMVPKGYGRALVPWTGPNAAGMASQSASVLTIRFVRVQSGHVSGTLDPYADPQTGERLLTTFNGDIKGNTIEGTYTTRLPSGDTQTGRWSVQRGS
jgi:hypothetical protein